MAILHCSLHTSATAPGHYAALRGPVSLLVTTLPPDDTKMQLLHYTIRPTPTLAPQVITLLCFALAICVDPGRVPVGWTVLHDPEGHETIPVEVVS